MTNQIDLANPAIVKGSALSENGDIFGAPGGTIEGAAVTGGDVDTGDGLTVLGTVSPATEVETTPTQTFPMIGYDASRGRGRVHICDATCYAAATGSNNCQKAYNWMRSTWPASSTGAWCCASPAGPLHVRDREQPHELDQGERRGISDWGFDLNLRTNWNGTAGDVKHMHFISVAPRRRARPAR